MVYSLKDTLLKNWETIFPISHIQPVFLIVGRKELLICAINIPMQQHSLLPFISDISVSVFNIYLFKVFLHHYSAQSRLYTASRNMTVLVYKLAVQKMWDKRKGKRKERGETWAPIPTLPPPHGIYSHVTLHNKMASQYSECFPCHRLSCFIPYWLHLASGMLTTKHWLICNPVQPFLLLFSSQGCNFDLLKLLRSPCNCFSSVPRKIYAQPLWLAKGHYVLREMSARPGPGFALLCLAVVLRFCLWNSNEWQHPLFINSCPSQSLLRTSHELGFFKKNYILGLLICTNSAWKDHVFPKSSRVRSEILTRKIPVGGRSQNGLLSRRAKQKHPGACKEREKRRCVCVGGGGTMLFEPFLSFSCISPNMSFRQWANAVS